MKTIIKLILATVLLLQACTRQGEDAVSVITFNIRYDNPRDSVNAWPNRKSVVCEFLRSEKPDLFGLQEALWYQYEAIDSALTGYSSVAAGRDDGLKKGEMNPAFFRTDRFEFISDSTFWLSETPGVAGSKSWGSSLPRIVSWLKLKDRATGEVMFYFNTHFAHDSDSARKMSAMLLLREVKRIAGDENFVITGDFNMIPESVPYSLLTEAGRKDALLSDSYLISDTVPYGPKGTFNGWSDEPAKNRIDYIFVRKGIEVKSIRTVLKKQGAVFISDHWPVKAEILY